SPRMTAQAEGSMQRCARTLVLVALFGSVVRAQQLPTVAPETVGISSQRLARLHNGMQAFVDHRQVRGIVALVARDAKRVDVRTFGYQDVEGKKPMRTDTIFRIASMGKPITSVGVMMLYEEGKLSLRDPVSKYIPSFKNQKVISVSPNGTTTTVPAQREI